MAVFSYVFAVSFEAQSVPPNYPQPSSQTPYFPAAQGSPALTTLELMKGYPQDQSTFTSWESFAVLLRQFDMFSSQLESPQKMNHFSIGLDVL